MQRKWLPFLLALVGICACTRDKDEVTPSDEAVYQETVITYFKEIALGFEFGNASRVTRKWKNSLSIFVGGSQDPALRDELARIVAEINALATDGFTAQITADSSASNFYVFLGPSSRYVAMFPAQAANAVSNWGLFSVFFNANNELYRGYMYVDVMRANPTEQKHLLREELTQALGLARDSRRFPDSIFQEAWTTTTSYSKIDKELIQLLYHPQMQTGLDATTVEPVLRTILPPLL
jgi:hypothetical protein